MAISTTSRSRLPGLPPPAQVRLLLGYAGWGPGQIANEMAAGSWLHADVDARLVFDRRAESMWESALRSLGVDPTSVVQGRGVHWPRRPGLAVARRTRRSR